jgi:3-oxoacyl-[acyl-carrier-protein] synthase II
VDPRVAVVASSNLGNVGTVQSVVRALRQGGLKEVSALTVPNASSNVLASTVASWFRFGRPNLMVCWGAISGLEAVFLGCILLRAGRADRAIVVGAGPDDACAQEIYARRAARRPGERLRAGAAAAVLERADRSTDAPFLEVEDSSARFSQTVTAVPIAIGPEEHVPPADRLIDVGRVVGDLYGAQGVLQVALAASLCAAPDPAAGPIAVICGDAADGWRSLIVRARVGVAANPRLRWSAV